MRSSGIGTMQRKCGRSTSAGVRLVDAGALGEGRKLGLFEEIVEGSDLGCDGNLPPST